MTEQNAKDPYIPATQGAVDLSAHKRGGAVNPKSATAASGVAAGGAAGTGQAAGPMGDPRAAAPQAGPQAGAGNGELRGPIVRDVSEQELAELSQLSVQLPVILMLWSAHAEESKTMAQTLEQITRELNGRVVLAKVDIDANPQFAQALGTQAVPTVIALFGGRTVPLFQGTQGRDQIVAVLNELLQLAASSGLTGRMVDTEEDAQPQVDPLHEEPLALEDAGDIDGAIKAWHTVLANQPRDREAKEAIARLKLQKRALSEDTDTDTPQARADQALISGDTQAAFDIMLAEFERLKPMDAEAADEVRERLVEMFTVVGSADPAVKSARARLSALLF
ncbi:tetratricopeptide repeat protein [Gleimia hominis]|uniref:tetratricopeptide repeat protein n=1 Tax=Gleimia hominis TaxID=595468 RepID=UPI000C8027B9|nr:tetratricopeptide repeat protein [Gleimia hominis]WIK64838.1 tetratricopeptide repeat protein [Gleimia hominis]